MRSRRAALGAIAVGALPVGSLLVDGPEPAAAPTRTDAPTPVTAMAYNLHLFYEEDAAGRPALAAQADVIESGAADIVAVCESDGCRPTAGNVDGLAWLARRLGYHAAFGAPSRLRSYGVGLLSRWPIHDVAVHELPVVRSPPRLAVEASLETPNGPLTVIATHFMTEKPGDVRAAQAAAVVDLASGLERAVVLGDFNVVPDPAEPAYRTLDAAFTDAWTAAATTRGGAATYSAADPRRRIDYVWLQGGWRVHEAATLGTPRASDHRAVLATIEPR